MSRLPVGQLAAAALVTDAFSLLCMRGGVSAVTAAGALAGTLVQLLAVIPLLRGKEIRPGKASGLIMLAILVGWGGVLFSELWRTSGVVYIPWEDRGLSGELLVGGVLAAVCLYVTSDGLRTLGRCAAAAAVFGGACLAGVLISAGFASDWGNLAIKRTADSFPRELLRGISLSGGTAVFASLCGGGAKACAARYFAGKAVLSTAVILTSVLVAGGVMELAQFPAITAAQLSQPFSSQRIDSLFLMAFSACAVFGGAALAAPAAELLGKVFPKFRRFRGLAVLAAMLLAGVAFRFAEGAGELFALGVPMLVFAAGALSERRAEA